MASGSVAAGSAPWPGCRSLSPAIIPQEQFHSIYERRDYALQISLFFPNKLYCNGFNLKSYLRIVGPLEVGQQQADKHRALLLLTHKSADPKKQ